MKIDNSLGVNIAKSKCMICGFGFGVHRHHIIPRAKGGNNVPENLVDLCPNHHCMAHLGFFSREELREINLVQCHKYTVNKTILESNHHGIRSEQMKRIQMLTAGSGGSLCRNEEIYKKLVGK